MKHILFLLLIIIGNVSFSEQSGFYSNYSQYRETPQEKERSSSGEVMDDCSHLSLQEQAFAKSLSVMHRTMFCRHFSVSQRLDAMTLASSRFQRSNGQAQTVTPDEAVEIVMKNAREPGSAASQESKGLYLAPDAPKGGDCDINRRYNPYNSSKN